MIKQFAAAIGALVAWLLFAGGANILVGLVISYFHGQPFGSQPLWLIARLGINATIFVLISCSVYWIGVWLWNGKLTGFYIMLMAGVSVWYIALYWVLMDRVATGFDWGGSEIAAFSVWVAAYSIVCNAGAILGRNKFKARLAASPPKRKGTITPDDPPPDNVVPFRRIK